MATYAIGDLQGCYRPFLRLLEEIEFDADKDRLWLVGDLVNRGPASLEVLRWCYSNRERITVVLGNHDIYLLARATHATRPKGGDTLDDILEATDGEELLDWLSRRPLLHQEDGFLMVHAGLHPSWTVDDAVARARSLEEVIRGGHRHTFVELLRSAPAIERTDFSPSEQRRYDLAVLTRMRMCRGDGAMDFDYKGPLDTRPDDLQPWFALPHRRDPALTVLFGHWAALGLHLAPGVVGLDSGCVWGRCLTALRLEDRTLFKVPCEPRALAG